MNEGMNQNNSTVSNANATTNFVLFWENESIE